MTPSEGFPEHMRVYILESIFTSSRCSSTPATMDGEVWGSMPHDILEKILLLLPAASQVRFRAVCKAWQLKLQSQEFRERSAALAFSSGTFLCGLVYRMEGDWWQDKHMHYNSRHKVLQLSFPYLPVCLLDFLRKCRGSRQRFFFVQNGLVALEARIPDYRLCVINPVNGTWRELPYAPISPSSRVVGISVVTEAGKKATYEVLVHHADDRSNSPDGRSANHRRKNSFWSYSSGTNTWSNFKVDAAWLARPLASPLKLELLYARLLRKDIAAAGVAWPTDESRLAAWPTGESRLLFRFLFAGEDSSGIWLVAEPKYRFGCEIWRLDGTGTGWETVAALPDDIRARMMSPEGADSQSEEVQQLLQHERGEFIYLMEGLSDDSESEATEVPAVNDRLDVEAADRAGSIILIQAVVGRMNGPYSRYFLAYHTVLCSWEVICSDLGCTECVKHQLFQPASSVDVT